VECSAVLAPRNRHKKSVAYSVIILVAKFLCSNGLTFVLGIVILAFSAVRVLDSALFSSDVGHAESRHPLSRGSVGSCTGVYQVGLLLVDPLWISRVKDPSSDRYLGHAGIRIGILHVDLWGVQRSCLLQACQVNVWSPPEKRWGEIRSGKSVVSYSVAGEAPLLVSVFVLV